MISTLLMAEFDLLTYENDIKEKQHILKKWELEKLGLIFIFFNSIYLIFFEIEKNSTK